MALALEEPEDTADVNVLLDIDCYRQQEVAPLTEELWRDLQELRGIKNRIFFGSITEEAAQEFE